MGTVLTSRAGTDREGAGIRFGCGALLGLILAAIVLVQMMPDDWSFAAPLGIGLAALLGLLSAKYGDRFWYWMLDRLRWWL